MNRAELQREEREREVGKRRGRDSRQAQQRGGPIVLGPQNVHRWITHFQILLPCVLCAVRVSAGYIHFESKASCQLTDDAWGKHTRTHAQLFCLLSISNFINYCTMEAERGRVRCAPYNFIFRLSLNEKEKKINIYNSKRARVKDQWRLA